MVPFSSPPPPPSGPLSPRHLGSQLAELERAIEKMMEADFVKFAMEDIQQRQQYAQEMAAAHSNPERADSEVCTAMLLYWTLYMYVVALFSSVLWYTLVYCSIHYIL